MSTRRRQPPESCRAGVSDRLAQPVSLQRIGYQLPGAPARRPREPGGKVQVLPYGEHSIHAVFLEHQAKAPPHLALIPGDIVTEDASRAARWRQQRGKEQHRRRLAGAVGAKETNEGARNNLKVQILERPRGSVVSAQTLSLNGRNGRGHTRCGSPAKYR